MSDESESKTSPSAPLPPRQLFVPDSAEVEAVSLIPIPPHPSLEFDDTELRMLVANTYSLTLVEKVRLILGIAAWSQQQVDGFLEILRRDREQFLALNDRHNVRLAELEQRHAEERQRGGDRSEPKPTTSELSPADRAQVIRKAVDRLLEPVGAGEAMKFLAAFLQRIVWHVGVERGNSMLEGDLPTIFGAELRKPELNRHAHDPSSDMRVINTLVRPALSKLRRSVAMPMVRYQGSIFGVAMVIEGPDRPKGRVKQQHRIGVLVRLNAFETTRLLRRRAFRMHIAQKLIENDRKLVRVERLGPFAGVIRRIVEKFGYSSESERELVQFDVLRTVLGDIISVLPCEERLQYLMYLLALPIRWSGSVPSDDFENWFINAVELNEGLTKDDERYDYGVGRFQMRLRYSGFGFPTQVLLLKAYSLATGPERLAMTAQLRSLDDGAAETLPEPDAIRQPLADIDLESLLAKNSTNVGDLVRIIEAQVLDDFMNG